MGMFVLILLLWCVPSVVIVVATLLWARGRMRLAKQWHLHEVFHGHHAGQA